MEQVGIEGDVKQRQKAYPVSLLVEASLGVLAEGWFTLALILAPVLFTGVYLVYYSYSEYQRLAVKPVN